MSGSLSARLSSARRSMPESATSSWVSLKVWMRQARRDPTTYPAMRSSPAATAILRSTRLMILRFYTLRIGVHILGEQDDSRRLFMLSSAVVLCAISLATAFSVIWTSRILPPI